MAMKARIESAFVMFDVVYTDGSRRSNRKVPATALLGFEGDEAARGVIEAQDREISLASGRPSLEIRTIERTPPKPEPIPVARKK